MCGPVDFGFATPGAHPQAGVDLTSSYNTQSNHITTSSNHPTEFTSTTQQAMRNKLTFASRSPRMLGRPPRPTCPTCRRAACHRLRSTFDARTRHHQTIRTTPMHAPIWLQQGCATSAMPPAVWRCAACRSRCVHLPCPPATPVPLERCVPPLASCCQTRPARSCTVTHRS